MRRPAPHVQRGIRLAIAVFIACVIGYGVVLPRGGKKLLYAEGKVQHSLMILQQRSINLHHVTGIHDHYERQWVQSFKWCAITCVVSHCTLCNCA